MKPRPFRAYLLSRMPMSRGVGVPACNCTFSRACSVTPVLPYSGRMKCLPAALSLLLALARVSPCQKIPGKAFHWNWRDNQSAENPLASEKHLTSTERNSLLDALTHQYKGEIHPEKLAAETPVELIDLNGDGVAEVVAQAVSGDFCSPTGNCAFWVFEKSASGYKLILQKGAVQFFTIQPTRTNGFIDLVLGMHGSATEQGLYLYRFSKGRYRRAACYLANWTFLDKNEEVHELKEPRITPCRP
jgi:hypothetical protein